MRDLTVGLAQITARADPDANRQLSLDAAGALFEQGAQLVVLPELIVPGYRLDASFQTDGSEPLDGPTVRAWQELAARVGGYIAGGICERHDQRLYNAAVLVGPAGTLLHYRKLHTFGHERGIFAPGDLGLPIARLPFGTVGLCICYDLRFVETARILALRGAELICVPTAWVAGFDQRRWDREGFCPQARGAQLQANLDQVYIACASQAGDAWEQQFLGSSVVCDPYGAVPLGPLPADRDELAITTIDLDSARQAQSRGDLINPRADRRSDVYGLMLEGTAL
jgi:N-carbamoylputrescine amidase